MSEQQINVPKPLLDVEQAAMFLRRHVETVRREAREGKLPAYKYGSEWRFDEDELREAGKCNASSKDKKMESTGESGTSTASGYGALLALKP